MTEQPISASELNRRVTFYECALVALENPAFVEEFNRLTNRSLGKQKARSAIERMIDEATGYNESAEDMQAFCLFIYEIIWLRMPEDALMPGDPVAAMVAGKFKEVKR